MSHISVDLLNLYKTYFGGNYEIADAWRGENWDNTNRKRKYNQRTIFGTSIAKEGVYGVTVFFPIKIVVNENLSIDIDCATIKVTNKKTIIKTPVARRIGTVKEQYAIGDYVFTINGVLIGSSRGMYPDDLVFTLREIYESRSVVNLENVISDLFIANGSNESTERCPVVIESLEFHEKKGDARHAPFTIVCETDFAETLIFSEEIERQMQNVSSNI